MTQSPARPRAALFVTCLVDLFRPRIGFAAVELLERAGYEVVIPRRQTCCGQPAWNSGDRATARTIAKDVVDSFRSADLVVVPSGSCTGMLRRHYPEVFAGDPEWEQRALEFAGRCRELTELLADHAGEIEAPPCALNAAYHDSCSSLREVGIKREPRRLLERVPGLKLSDLNEPEVCCGFGGTFCVKNPEVSAHMADAKIGDARSTGAEVLIGNDLGCLLHLEGRMRRRGLPIRARHIAEVLTGAAAPPEDD
jgi:L-lactate dehydrogenase complex protein LldE